MKKLYLALLLIPLMFVSCSPDYYVSDYVVVAIGEDTLILKVNRTFDNSKTEVDKPDWFDGEIGDVVYVRIYDNGDRELVKEVEE